MGENGKLASRGCKTSCGTECVPTMLPTVDMGYEDSSSWHVLNNPNKDCEWISAYPVSRCKRTGIDNGTEIMAFISCCSTCGTCMKPPTMNPTTSGGCEDDSTWYANNKPNKNCEWVAAQYTSNRCNRKSAEGILASAACVVTCNTC